MYQSTVRSTTANPGKTALALVAIFSLLLSLFAIAAQPVLADGNDSPTECLDSTPGVTGSIEGTDDEVTFTAVEGEVVTGVCIKTGESAGHTGLITADGPVPGGCYTVAGIGTATVTVTRTGEAGPECQAISHIDVVTETAPAELTGELIVVKEVINDDGGTMAVGDFELFVDGNAVVSGATTVVEAGAHVVSETAVEGYTGSIGGDCDAEGNVTVIAGETATCTITNDDVALVAEDGQIAIFKTMCESIGEQNVCNGRDTSLDGYMIDFEIYAGTGTGGELVETATVTLSENAEGQGNTGNGSQGRILSGDLAEGTYTVCEVPVAYMEGAEDVPLEVVPRPESGNGGSTGGNQTLFGDNCIVVEVKASGTAEVKFLDTVAEGEQDEFGRIEIVKEANDAEETFGFSATWEDGEFTLMGGDSLTFGDFLAGDIFTVTEELTPEQIAAGWTLLGIDCGEAEVEIVGNAVTITVVANTTITCTFTNELEVDEGEGELEIIKFFCPTVGTDAIFVFGPLTEEPISLQQVEEDDELPSEENCSLGAPDEEALGATFTITGGDLAEPMVVTTEWEEILTLDLAPGDYTIVEEGTGLTADFTVLAEGDTAVVVFNYDEEAEENEGRLKILKFYCVGEGDPVFTAVDGDAGLADVTLPANCESPEPGDADFTLTMGELTSGVFDLGDDGARLIPLPAGTYVLNEVDPNEASSAEFAVTADETTTVIVFNFEEEGEAPNEGTQGGNPKPKPGEGTLGGNPLPNTAISPTPTGSVPAALLALLMLSSLGAAAYAVKAEVRRRR